MKKLIVSASAALLALSFVTAGVADAKSKASSDKAKTSSVRAKTKGKTAGDGGA